MSVSSAWKFVFITSPVLLGLAVGFCHQLVAEDTLPKSISPESTLSEVSTASIITQSSGQPAWQRIDETISAYHRGPVVPVVNNGEFLRRVYLDIIGRIPTSEETTTFLSQFDGKAEAVETTIQVRERVIDDLLSRSDFSAHYARVLEVMFSERRLDGKVSLQEFRGFIRRWLEDRRPLNELCMEILAADGTGDQYRPAASFFLNREAEPNLLTRDIGRIFFGRDVQCAQCHNHPLIADYEQAEYFGILSFINRSFLFQDERRGNWMFLGEKADGKLEFASVFRPENGARPAEPVLPTAMAIDSEPVFVDDSDAYIVAPSKEQRAVPRHSRRQQLAVLATHPKNQAFNRNLANRLWAQMLGVGIVHPVDAHHSGNPPASSALLRLLSDELVASQYDLRWLLKQIAMSQAYQRSQVITDLHTWSGPVQGKAELYTELSQLTNNAQLLTQQQPELQGKSAEADEAVRVAQLDVSKVQKEIDALKEGLQQLSEALSSKKTQLTELEVKHTNQKNLLVSLQAAAAEAEKAAAEAEKAVKLIPTDEELIGSQALLTQRVTAVSEGLLTLENSRAELQELIEQAQLRVDDQRSRIIALGSRQMAMSEFVAEARGVQRNMRSQQQELMDRITDGARQEQRCHDLLSYLELREQVGQAVTDRVEPREVAVEVATKLELAEKKLIASWRRSHALGQIRSLTPEQLSSATFYALELDRSVHGKVEREWETVNVDNPTIKHDLSALQKRISEAIAERQWEIEDHLAPRFSSPPGTPQDGFFATPDQALLIQNDPTFQSWLQASEGTLLHRLSTMQNEDELVDALYLSVLSRQPDSEERAEVSQYIASLPDDRSTVLRELVWGLLASAEFRFMP